MPLCPAALLAVCSKSSCPPPAKSGISVSAKGSSPFHTLLHVTLDPGFLPLTTTFPSKSEGMGRCQVGVGAPAKEMAAQSSVQVKLKIVTFKEKNWDRELGKPRVPEPMGKVQRCQAEGIFKPQHLAPGVPINPALKPHQNPDRKSVV